MVTFVYVRVIVQASRLSTHVKLTDATKNTWVWQNLAHHIGSYAIMILLRVWECMACSFLIGRFQVSNRFRDL